MADHFVSLTRGEEGLKFSDFTTGAASTAGDIFEFRVTDGVTGPRLTKVEVVKALEAFIRFFENAQQVGASGFDVSG